MALNIGNKTEISPEVQVALDAAKALLKEHNQLPVAAPVRVVPTGPVALELAIYKRYIRVAGGQLYEGDKYYNFTPEQAAILLQETEDNTGRPIWRRYKVGQQKVIVVDPTNKAGIDATGDKIAADSRDQSELDAQGTTRIEIGTDDEIADILNEVNSQSGIEV